MIGILVKLLWAAAAVAQALRWLRVAQREHYIPGSASRFWFRWFVRSSTLNFALMLLAGTPVIGALILLFWPVGLGLRGRTGRLAWTRRMRTLAVVVAVLAMPLVLVPSALSRYLGASASLMFLFVDLALFITRPVERRLGDKWVRQAREKMGKVAPTVVAITGSYGKTSTKTYLAHLLAGARTVVPSPKSFNNRAGLARAINENLVPGTEVFIAEMGTYGKGEIADMCSWVEPSIAVITAIGPVHLERMKTEERIVEAKAEILATASQVVLNVDDARLAALASSSAVDGKKVWRVSAQDPNADVAVVEGALLVGGEEVGRVDRDDLPATNLACAVAAALALGLPARALVDRVLTIPLAEHRLTPEVGPTGVAILDDTFNSNPAGARRALDALRATGGPNGQRVLVTPGMVELGKRQAVENAELARDAADSATRLLVVGQINRGALVAGAQAASLPFECVPNRDAARDWVRANLGEGDAVLYENDLPDHYP